MKPKNILLQCKNPHVITCFSRFRKENHRLKIYLYGIRYGWMMAFLLVSFLSQSQVPPINISDYKGKIRVACIGNDVTFGEGLVNREINSYPTLLQKKLGDKFQVENFGVSGATLLRNGHQPYGETAAFNSALDFNPHVVVIDLGLNDADIRDWPNFQDDFTEDYLTLIEKFRNLSTNPRIWICKMTPMFSPYETFKAGAGSWHWQIQEAIDIVSKVSGTGLIDLHTPLYSRPDLFQDFIHPDAEGTEIIVQTVYQEITGDFGGLSMPKVLGSNMVLQREKDIPIWGKADYNQEVEVIFGSEKVVTKVDVHGNWSVIFPPKEAGGPYEIIISSGEQKIIFSNVLIGEVWLSSGQSNMDFKLFYSLGAEKVIAGANYPDIRFLSIKSADTTIRDPWGPEMLKRINEKKYRGGTWKKCTPETAKDFAAIAYYFGLKLSNELNVPIGLIDNSKGGSPAEAWIDRKSLESNPYLIDILDDWKNNLMFPAWCRGRGVLNLQNAENPRQRHSYEPTYLFDALTKPLIGFPIKGVLWYQGESNTYHVELHEKLFPELIQSWRSAWGEDFPFYYVQLSSFDRASWPRFRDSQRRLMEKIPHTGMVVSIDVGDSLDIHPRKKREVGERLALWALAKDYHREVEFSGPLFLSATFDKERAIVDFKQCQGLRSSDGKPIRSFEIAGEDKIFKPGTVEIIGNKIEVHSDEVGQAKYVRYGWQPYTTGNLINEADLPASTFSSEFER